MISIILGAFNRLGKLKSCMNSIKVAGSALSEPPEIIILDGGSTDGTLEYLKELSTTMDIKLIEEGALHGVTRAYNRGFRLASKKYVTWTSDDCEYMPDCLINTVNRLNREAETTMVSISMSDGPGKPFINYGENTPIGACSKSLFKMVDFWSEDFITYGSDNDFSIKIHRLGGRVVAELSARVIHNLDLHDNLHNINVPTNIDSARYVRIYGGKDFNLIKTARRIYPNVWISADSIHTLMSKLHECRKNITWGNIFTNNDFGFAALCSSMNITVTQFAGKPAYDVII